MVSNPNISVDTASHIGSLNNVVRQLLQKEKFDLVVMGKNDGKHIEAISALLKQQLCPFLITHAKDSL